MTVSPQHRRQLRLAIDGVLDGTLTTSDGKLTWKSVAALAGVSKATADRAVDLRAEFRRRLHETLPPTPSRPLPTTTSRGDPTDELARLRRENAELKQATKTLHSTILALVHENHQLARRRSRGNVERLPLPNRAN